MVSTLQAALGKGSEKMVLFILYLVLKCAFSKYRATTVGFATVPPGETIVALKN